jgi:hypothetical protein
LEVVKVSTRGAVLFEVSNGCYEAYYNHCDSYPTWLGVRLAEMLKQGRTADEIVEVLKLKDYQKVIAGTFGYDVAKQVYPGLQADLEWIYVVNFNPPSLQVFKTSNPDLIHGPDFVFSAWFSYVQDFPENIDAWMAEVEETAGIALKVMASYHGATKNGPYVGGGQDGEG